MPSSKSRQESIKITIRKTDPWEVLLHERLCGLPDNHRKLFFNALVRASGVRLSDQKEFNKDVENFLITLPSFKSQPVSDEESKENRVGATTAPAPAESTEKPTSQSFSTEKDNEPISGFGALSI